MADEDAARRRLRGEHGGGHGRITPGQGRQPTAIRDAVSDLLDELRVRGAVAESLKFSGKGTAYGFSVEKRVLHSEESLLHFWPIQDCTERLTVPARRSETGFPASQACFRD